VDRDRGISIDIHKKGENDQSYLGGLIFIKNLIQPRHRARINARLTGDNRKTKLIDSSDLEAW
jgi:hypothetical protein